MYLTTLITIKRSKMSKLSFPLLLLLISFHSLRSEEEKTESVNRIRIAADDGGKDWILETKGDIVQVQYRDGVSY